MSDRFDRSALDLLDRADELSPTMSVERIVLSGPAATAEVETPSDPTARAAAVRAAATNFFMWFPLVRMVRVGWCRPGGAGRAVR